MTIIQGKNMRIKSENRHDRTTFVANTSRQIAMKKNNNSLTHKYNNRRGRINVFVDQDQSKTGQKRQIESLEFSIINRFINDFLFHNIYNFLNTLRKLIHLEQIRRHVTSIQPLDLEQSNIPPFQSKNIHVSLPIFR